MADRRSQIDAFFDQEEEEQRPQQLPVVDPMADLRSPDDAAAERRIADEVGEPPQAVRAYPELFSQRAEAQRTQRATQGSPRLQAWLNNPDNHAVARDDVENLSVFDRVARTVAAMNPATAIGADIVGAFTSGDPLGNEQGRQGELDVEHARLAYRAHQAVRGRGELSDVERARLDELATREGQDWGGFIVGPTRRMFPQMVGAVTRGVEQAGQRAGEVWDDPLTLREGERWSARRVLEGGTAALLEVPAVAVATFGGAAGGYLSFGYEMETGIAFDTMVRQGIDPAIAADRAEQYGATATAIEFASDALGLKISSLPRLGSRLLLGEQALARGGAGQAALRFGEAALGTASEQGVEESLQEYAQIIHQDLAEQDQASGDASTSRVRWSEVLTPEHIEQILQAGYIGAQGGFGMGSVPASLNLGLDMRAASQADRAAQVFEQWTRAAQASRLNERGLTSTMESAIGAMDESNVYIDADRFIEHFQSAGVNAYAVAEELGIGEAGLAQAVASHGQVQIPTAAFAARVLRVPAHAGLSEHARIAPDADTPAEAKAMGARVQAMVEQIAEETKTAQTDNDIGQAVETRMRELFTAAAEEGGPTAAVSARYARLVSALPRAVLARARASGTPEYAAKLEQSFRTLFGENLDVAGPGREAGAGIGAELPQGSAEQVQRHYEFLDSILEERRSLSNPSIRRAPPAQVPEVGTREYAEAVVDAREAKARGERLTPIQNALVNWEADNVIPDGLFQSPANARQAAPWIAERFSQEEIDSWLALADDAAATPEQILSHPIQVALEAEAPPPVFTKETIAIEGALAERRYQIDGQEFDALGYLAHMRAKLEADVPVPLRQEKVAVLVTGQPGAGKSTTRQGLASVFGAVSIDLDEMRVGIPEYAEGKGSSRTTQAEAGQLRKILVGDLVSEGQNLLYEMVGKTTVEVLDEAARLKAAGYSVSLANVNVSYDNSVRRYARRTISGGRWVHADYISAVADEPARIFDALVAEGSLSGYIQVDGNGPQGSETVTHAQGATDKEALEAALRLLGRPGRDDGGVEQTQPDARSPDGQDAQGGIAGRRAAQDKRGSIRYDAFKAGEFGTAVIKLGEASDLSTFLHEFGHLGHLILESIATDAAAPAELKAMWDSTLSWWGLDQEQWSALTPEQKTPYFETWARTFEAYLMEGKAPSLSLREAFATFKAWLTQIYRSVLRLDARLTPEIRDVFDRLLATDAEIAEARAAMGSDFALSREAFKSEEEFAQYQGAIAEARDAQEAELRARAMDAYARKSKRWWRGERERMRDAATRAVDSDPARRAEQWIGLQDWRALPDTDLSDEGEISYVASENALEDIPEGLPTMRLSAEAIAQDWPNANLPTALQPRTDVEATLAEAMKLKAQTKGRGAFRAQRLARFIKDSGGLRVADLPEEHRNLFTGVARRRPGLINNESGKSPEEMMRLATEAGYFGEGAARELRQGPDAGPVRGGINPVVPPPPEGARRLFNASTVDHDPNGYLDPHVSGWVEEVANGAGDFDNIGDITRPLVYMSDNPESWVRMIVGRKIGKHPNDVTIEDIRAHGRLNIVDADPEYDNIFQVGEHSADDSVTTLGGERRRMWETNLYDSEDFREMPVGPEPDDFISREPVQVAHSLTGDDLVRFLEQNSSRTAPDGGGAQAGRLPRTVIDATPDYNPNNIAPAQIIRNPSEADLARLTRRPREADPAHGPNHYNTLRWIRDRDGNVYVGNSFNFTHDDLVRGARGLEANIGETVSGANGTISRKGDSFVTYGVTADGAPLSRDWLAGRGVPEATRLNDLTNELIDRGLYMHNGDRAATAAWVRQTVGSTEHGQEAIRRLLSPEADSTRAQPNTGDTHPGFELFQSARAPIFESAALRAVERSTTARASAQQWLATIQKTPGVKKEELEWIGLADWLNTQTGLIPREEVLAFVRENGVRVEETVLGEDSVSPEVQRELLPLVEERDRVQAALFNGDFKATIAAATQDARVQAAYRAYQEAERAATDALARELDAAEPRVVSENQWAWEIESSWGQRRVSKADYERRGVEGALDDVAQTDRNRYDDLHRLEEQRRLELRREATDLRSRLSERISELEGERRKGAVRWSQYQLPGGENYRELILSVPDIEPFEPTDTVHFGNTSGGRVIAWTRYNERVDVNGLRTLNIEEFQSRRHQFGRDYGYKGGAEFRRIQQKLLDAGVEQMTIDALLGQGRGVSEQGYERIRSVLTDAELAELRAESGTQRVPDAPFKDNAWARLALKRMIRWAAENGFDQISWTRGQHQIERFNLATHISGVSYAKNADGTYSIRAFGTDKTALADRAEFRNLTPDQMAQVIGKDTANRIVEGAGERLEVPRDDEFHGHRFIPVSDMQVGGEGMRAFYDRILPNIANDLGKKFGARVGETDVGVSKRILPPSANGLQWRVTADDGRLLAEYPTEALAKKYAAGFETVHSLPITPEMREAVTQRGQELFQTPSDKAPTVSEFITTLISDLKNERLVYSARDPNALASAQALADAQEWFDAHGIDLGKDKETIRGQIVAAIARDQREPISFRLYRGVAKGRDPNATTGTSGGALFYSGDRKIAEDYAGKDGTVAEADVTFYNPLEAANWMEAKEKLGLARDVPMDGLIEAARNAGYDGLMFTTLNGREFILIPENNKGSAPAVHPDDAAGWFGFSSGDEMVQALSALKPRAVAIEEQIDRLVEEEHGDAGSKDRIAEEARLAAHAEVQARRIELELSALQAATGGRKRPVSNAARAYAERQVSLMTVKQVRNADQFLAGERRAARNAMEAAEKGDHANAAMFKQRQLISFFLYRFARDAATEMEKAQSYFQKFDRNTVRAKIHPPLMDQIDQALEGIDLRAKPRISDRKRQNFNAWLEEMKAEGLEHLVVADPDFIAEAQNRPFTSLTLEEARGIRDAVRNFEHIGRRWREVLGARDARLLDEAVGDMTASMATVKPLAFVNPADHSPGLVERIDAGRQGFHAQLSRVEFVARAMDGMKDNGPVWNGLFRPITEARDREETRQQQAQRDIENLFSVYDAKERADMWTKRRFYPQVPNRDGTGMGRNFTKQEILAIALNTGNEYNFGALIAGDNWSEQQVRALLDAAMDQRDWQFVQNSWDYVESFWPEIEALYLKTAGVAPAKVKPTPFQNRFGEWRGGYWHLEYDYGRDQRVREEMEAGAVQEAFGGLRLRTQTPNGFSKARQGSGGRPVRLELSIFTEHVNEVIHDLEFRMPVLNVWRLIKHGGFREAFVRAAGQAQYDQLKPWLQYVATERMPPERGFAGIIKLLRRNTPIALMGYAVSTVAQQPAGLMGTFHRVGTGRVMGKALELLSQPWKLPEHARFINARSTLMRNRTMISQREIREMVQEINSQGHIDAVNLMMTGNLSQKKAAFDRVAQVMQRYALFPLAYVDKWVSSAAWKAAYDRALAGHVKGVDPQSEADVIAFADQIIRTTFGSGRPEDLSPVMRSSEIGKLITPAFSYFNTQYNQLYNEQAPGMMRGQISPLEFTTFIVFTLVAQALISQWLAGRWEPDEDEDDEDRNIRLATEVALTPIAGIPLVRDMARSTMQTATTGATFGSTVPAFGALSSTGVGVGGAINDLSEDGEISRRSARDLTMAAGYWFGIPSNALWRAGESATDVATGEDDLSDPVDTAAETFLRDRR